MENLVYYLPALACVGGMLLCMFVMSRGMSSKAQAGEGSGEKEVVRLREEVGELRAELSRRHTPSELSS